MKRKLFLIIIMLYLCALPAGCYDQTEIDDLTYTIAVGLDKGVTAPLRITLQYAVPRAMEQGDAKGSLNTITIDAPSLYTGINTATSFLGRRINLSNAKAFVISEALAREGIGEVMNTLAHSKELRPTIFIAVCKGTASDYIKKIEPEQEADPSKFYELFTNTFRYTGQTVDSRFYTFYSQMNASDVQAVAALAEIDQYPSSKALSVSVPYSPLNASILYPNEAAASAPENRGQKNELMGLALFRGDQMIGEANGMDAFCYLILTGTLNNAYISIPYSETSDIFLSLRISQQKKPHLQTAINNGKPEISAAVYLEADLLSSPNKSSEKSPGDLKEIEKIIKDFMKKKLTNFLLLTSRQYKSDIFGFGKDVKTHFLYWKDWEQYDWLNHYKDADFNVHINLLLRNEELTFHAFPVISAIEKEP